jgi:hypothetical protein
MNKKIILSLATACAFLSISLFVACGQKTDKVVDGLAPLYLNPAETYKVEVQGVKPTIAGGKIYQHGPNYTLQVDVNTGVHIINCTDAKNPTKVQFISIPGVTEITVKDNILIANNTNDIVSIDISNLQNIQLVNRVKDVYKTTSSSVPSVANTYYECPDVNKGIIVGWQKKKLTNPKCKTL